MRKRRAIAPFLADCVCSEYRLPVVNRRTTLDQDRTPAIVASELRLWDECASHHTELGTEGYRTHLTEQIDRLETEACGGVRRPDSTSVDEGTPVDDNARSFLALRRLVAILLQERAMLDMSEPQLRAIGFDSAFIALGRWCVFDATCV